MPFEVGSAVARLKADITGFKEGIGEAKTAASGLGDTVGNVTRGIADFGKQAAMFTGIFGGAMVLFGKQSLDSFNQSEAAVAQLDAVLKSTAGVMSQQEKTTKSTKLSTAATSELNDKLKDQTAKLHDMEAAWAKNKTHTETASRNLEKTRAEVAKLSGQLGHAGDVITHKFIPPTQMSRQALLDLSTSLQNTTTFSDETVLSAESLLLTFTNIGKDVFPDATKTVLDMSQALGQDTKSSAIQLGKALQDPILGISALRRVGVNFSEDQQKVIEKLVKSGKTLDAQKMILKELNTEFGGSAAAAAETFGGRIEQLKNKFDDLKEKIGGVIAGVATLLATGHTSESFLQLVGLGDEDPIILGLIRFRQALLDLSQWVQDNRETVITFLTGLSIGIGALMIIGTVTALVTALLNPLTLVVIGVTALYMAWQTNFMGIQDVAQQFMDWVNAVFMPAFDVFVGFFKDRWGAISLIVKGSWDIIKNVVKLGWDIISGLITIGLQLMAGNWSGAWETVKTMTGKVWEDLKGIFNGAIEFLKGWGGEIVKSITEPFENAWNKVKETADKIKGAMDPNQRHSPSLVDRVQKGVQDLNAAWGELTVAPMVQQMNPVGNAVAAGAVAGGGMAPVSLYISLDGALIADDQSAQRVATKIGDSIIKKLQTNIRF